MNESQSVFKPRLFCFHFIFAVLILLAVVLGFNIIINPYGMYATNWLKPLVWSDRKEKLQLLEKYPEEVDLLVIGSSRTMRLDPELFYSLTGLEGFNLSVNHARTEDFLALVRYVVSKTRKKPRVVVVGVDINSFRGFYQIDNLLKYYPELYFFLNKNEKAYLIDKYGQFLVDSSLNFLIGSNFVGVQRHYLTINSGADELIDGSGRYLFTIT